MEALTLLKINKRPVVVINVTSTRTSTEYYHQVGEEISSKIIVLCTEHIRVFNI